MCHKNYWYTPVVGQTFFNHLHINFLFQKLNIPVRASCAGRGYATLSDEQKDRLANGPDLGDFITGDVSDIQFHGADNIKRVKGER